VITFAWIRSELRVIFIQSIKVRSLFNHTFEAQANYDCPSTHTVIILANSFVSDRYFLSIKRKT
jgi:hypothetical protein